jgi:hypothetical protein
MFADDLLAGKTVELEVAEKLEQLGYEIEFNESADKNILKE